MTNIDMKVEGVILTIRIDLSKNYGPSKTGKSITIASSEGNASIPERDEKIGIK